MHQKSFHQNQNNHLNKSSFFLLGLMGSGKSFWCDHIGKLLQLPCFHLDDEIEKEEQKTIADIFKDDGETYFRHKETEVLKSFSGKQSFVLSVGGGTPCFNNNIDWMNANGITIWLDESLQTIEKRLLKEKAHRPLIADINDAELFSFLSAMLEKRLPYYSKAKHHLKENEINEAALLNIFNT